MSTITINSPTNGANFTNTASPAAVTLGAAVTAGDRIILFVESESGHTVAATNSVSTVSSSPALTWQKYTSKQNATGNGTDRLVEMEVWYADSAGAIGASTLAVTVTMTGAVDNGYISLVTATSSNGVVDWDVDGPFTNANITSSVTAASVTGVNIASSVSALMIFFGSSSGCKFGTPTGYTTIQNTSNFNGNSQNGNSWVYKNFSATQSGLTISGGLSATGGTNGAEWAVIAASVIPGAPPPTGTMAATETADTFAGVGGLVGGALIATEAKDVLHFVGGTPVGSWASVESKDVWSAAGYPKLTGTFLATETADIASMTGSVTVPVALDGHATGQAGGTNITSATATLTTTQTDDVIVVNVVTGGFFAQGMVTSITDTAGLTWKRRSRRSFSPKTNGTLQFTLDTWWAHAPAALAGDVITVHTAATGLIAIETFGVSGANFTTPWDTHTGSGLLKNSLQINIASDDPAVSVFTAVPRTFTFGVYGSSSAPSATTTAAFTYLESIHGTENTSGTACYVAMAYTSFNAQQFGSNAVDFFVASPPISGFADYSVYCDSIVAAGETGTADAVRWFFDGAGNRNIVALAGSGNSITTNVATFNANSVMCVAVTMEAGGTLGSPTVNHITDTNSTSGWTRRSRVTDALGLFVMELWYVQMPLPLPTVTGGLTVVCDNVTAGDLLSIVCFAINGPDIFLRGELFDGHASLPAASHGEAAAFQTVGPFSTINLNVLEIAIGANQSIDLTGFSELPWLPLKAPAELVSSTPSFNVALQFKFSGAVVANDNAAFDPSPRPNHWLMLADALPVGPPTPPQGVWASTETKDFTGHTLDYTSIGIASPGGWVGLLPIHCTMAATDSKDKATNSGAFTALFDINGWVGFVPAHAAWASTDTKDIASWHAWVLGEPLVGRWRSTEARDRMGASNRATVTAVMAAQEAGDRHSGTAFLIPKAVPAPALKRNVVIVT